MGKTLREMWYLPTISLMATNTWLFFQPSLTVTNKTASTSCYDGTSLAEVMLIIATDIVTISIIFMKLQECILENGAHYFLGESNAFYI